MKIHAIAAKTLNMTKQGAAQVKNLTCQYLRPDEVILLKPAELINDANYFRPTELINLAKPKNAGEIIDFRFG